MSWRRYVNIAFLVYYVQLMATNLWTELDALPSATMVLDTVVGISNPGVPSSVSRRNGATEEAVSRASGAGEVMSKRETEKVKKVDDKQSEEKPAEEREAVSSGTKGHLMEDLEVKEEFGRSLALDSSAPELISSPKGPLVTSSPFTKAKPGTNDFLEENGHHTIQAEALKDSETEKPRTTSLATGSSIISSPTTIVPSAASPSTRSPTSSSPTTAAPTTSTPTEPNRSPRTIQRPTASPTGQPTAAFPVQVSNSTLVAPLSLSSSTPPFAYAFFLGGVTSTNEHHLGHLYNILVSVQILRESGSAADMVLLVHSVKENTTLPAKQESMLQNLGVQIRYAPYIGLDPTNYFEALPLEKFRIFDWTEYSRVLFIEADIMPHCNLDYLFEKSLEGILKENVLVSIEKSPASPNFFLIKPEEGSFQTFLEMVANFNRTKPPHPHQIRGKTWEYPRAEWTNLNLAENPPRDGKAIREEKWGFPGRAYDAGMLYSFMTQKAQQFSLIVGDQVYTSQGGNKLNGPDPSPIHQHTCQTNIAGMGNLTSQSYQSKTTKQGNFLSPSLGPYWDFAQWQHDDKKDRPWMKSSKHQDISSAYGAVQRWFRVLTNLDREHKFGLGLADEKSSSWAFVRPSGPWRAIPSRKMRVPLVEEWAQRQLDHHNSISSGITAKPTSLSLNSVTEAKPMVNGTEKRKRAFVCVTGQLERLELKDKLRELFRPIQQLGYDLDVALVLTGGKSEYTNQDREYNTKTHAPFYADFADAVQELTNHSINVLTKDTYDKLENPPFNQLYFNLLYQDQRHMRDAKAQRARVLNHPRIFESYGRCLGHAEEAVKRASEPSKISKQAGEGKEKVKNMQQTSESVPTLDNYYDVYFRIRDDIGFEDPLPKPVLKSLLQPSPGSVQVTGCRSWNGMNDRFASISPDVARPYFTQPYKSFFGVPKNRVFNPETYLLSTYIDAGLHILVNQGLKGLMKIVMTEEGEAAYAPVDLEERFCPKRDLYREHLLDLYGWDF